MPTRSSMTTLSSGVVHDDAFTRTRDGQAELAADLRERLAAAGRAKREGDWSETAHIERYMGLIERARKGKTARLPHQSSPRNVAANRGRTG